MWAGIGGVVVVVGALIAAALLVSGSHSGTNSASASASASALSASGGSDVGLLTGGLSSALMALPSGATAMTPTAGSPDGSLTLDQFIKILYPTSTTERAALQGRGFEVGATRWFQTSGGGSADVYLIQFQQATGAESYGLALSAAHRYNHAADPSFTIPGLSNGTGFEESALDTYGNTRTFVYGSIGNVTVLIHYYAPATLDRAGLMSIVNAQLARLQAAEQ